jgi:hypothetical protein
VVDRVEEEDAVANDDHEADEGLFADRDRTRVQDFTLLVSSRVDELRDELERLALPR